MDILGLLIGSWVNGNSVSHTSKGIPLYITQVEMKAEIAKRVPVNTSIESAQTIMTENNFICQTTDDRSFMEIDDNNSKILHENIDYLNCAKQVPGFPCAIKWQIALVKSDRSIQSVLVSKNSICL